MRQARAGPDGPRARKPARCRIAIRRKVGIDSKARVSLAAGHLYLLLGLAALALSPGAKASDPCELGRQVLTCKQLNVEVTAPQGWTWSENVAKRNAAEEQYIFLAKRDESTFFTLYVQGRGAYDNSESGMRQFLDGLEKGTARAGASVSDVQSSPMKTPAGQGHRFSYTLHLQRGDVMGDGFALAADRMYILQYISPARADVAQFNDAVQSMRLLLPIEAATPPGAPAAPAPATDTSSTAGATAANQPDALSTYSTLALALCAAAFVIGWLIGKVINRVSKRRVVNAALVGLVCILPVLAFQTYLIFRAGDRLVDASPEKQGEIVGETIGPGLLALAVAAALAMAESKRAAPGR